MIRVFFIILFFFPVIATSAQTYQELAGKAIDCIEKDSLHQAEDLLIQALKLEPKNPRNGMLFSNLGLVQRRLKEYEKSIESYTFANNLAPSINSILLDRAAVYMEVGKLDFAYGDYCTILDRDKDNKEALLMRAYIYVTRRDYPAARIDYERLLKLDPQNYNGRLGLATLEQREGKLMEAFERLNQMLADKPDDVILLVARADVEFEMKKEDMALIDLKDALKINSSSVDAYLLRGNIYLIQKKKELARADFEKAISLGVPRADLHEQLKLCK